MEVDPRSPERGQYAFVQALIREVAYGTLSRKARKTRHLAAARYFESLGSEELAGALAGHYLAAHQSAGEGDEAAALGAQARVALRAAAERASALGAHEQAIGFLQQAMTVSSDPRELAGLLEASGVAATAYQRFAEAEAFLRDALERREAIGDRQPIVHATTLLAMAIIRSFRFERALPVLEEATARFADMQGDPVYAGLEGQLARVYMLTGRNEAVLPIVERVLEVAERDELTELAANALITKGTTLDYLGRHFEAVGLIEAGRRLTERYGHWTLAPRAINNLASILAEDDPRAALAVAREGLELNRRIGERAFTMLDNAVYGAIRVGEWDWALEQLEATAPEETDAMARGAALAAMHQIRSYRGLDTGALTAELESLAATFDPDVGGAFTALERAYGSLASGDLTAASIDATHYAELWHQGEVEGYRVATRAALWARDVQRAREGLAAFERLRQHGGAVHMSTLTFAAGIAALEGRTSEALTMYRDALRGWEELGLPWDQALATVDMAMTVGPHEPAVATAAATARAILEGLGAAAILNRLDVAMSQRAKAGGRASAAARTREGASV
jgi:tetratricopeptide (TPR) repeat protein